MVLLPPGGGVGHIRAPLGIEVRVMGWSRGGLGDLTQACMLNCKEKQ